MTDGKDTAAKTKPLTSKRNAQNRPETIHRGSGFGRFCVSGANRQLGSKKEVSAMPRMPKYLKREWAFFLDERGRKKYNKLCRKCERICKQSFRATVIYCPHYLLLIEIEHTCNQSSNTFHIECFVPNNFNPSIIPLQLSGAYETALAISISPFFYLFGTTQQCHITFYKSRENSRNLIFLTVFNQG